MGPKLPSCHNSQYLVFMGLTVLWARSGQFSRPEKQDTSGIEDRKGFPIRFFVIDDSGDLSISPDLQKFSGKLVALIVGDVLVVVPGPLLFQNDMYLLAFRSDDLVKDRSWCIALAY